MDLALDAFKRPTRRLARVLEPLRGEYDYVFLDCPPSISLVSESVFEAADALLVPVIPATLSSRTFEQLEELLAADARATGAWERARRAADPGVLLDGRRPQAAAPRGDGAASGPNGRACSRRRFRPRPRSSGWGSSATRSSPTPRAARRRWRTRRCGRTSATLGCDEYAFAGAMTAPPSPTTIASYLADPSEVHRVLLLYSGGLDTSVMLKWIQDSTALRWWR